MVCIKFGNANKDSYSVSTLPNLPHRTGDKHNKGSDTSFNKNKHHTSRFGLGFIINIVSIEFLIGVDCI